MHGSGGSAAREALLLAGEALFAQHGFRGTSDRQIVLTAGQRNNSAIAYYFGSRQGLIEAIWFKHSAPVNLRRAEIMAELSDPPTAYELISAHVDPMVEELLTYRPSYWARFNEQHLIELRDPIVSSATARLHERGDGPPLLVLMRLFALMRERLAERGVGDTDLRVSLMTRLIVAGLAGWEREDEAATARRPPELMARVHVIKAVAAGMLAPDSNETIGGISP